MNFELVFNKTLEKLGLDPGEYKMEFTRDLSNLTAGSNPLGLACGKVRIIWVKDNLPEIVKVLAIIHEARHLYQFKKGYKYPADKEVMESDAKIYSSENLIDFYMLAKFGKILKGLELIRSGSDLYKDLPS